MRRTAFTLVELMMVIAIVAILAAMSLAALANAAEEGKRQRVRTQIAKIDQLIMDKWNSYRYRQLPIRIPLGTPHTVAAQVRLGVMRDLQRMELPDRLTDITNPPVTAMPVPALAMAYRRRMAATSASGNVSYDQAECLYVTLAEMRDGERSALDFFLTSEIGDVDGDGANEILDPWGNPIMLLRWAPGFSRFTPSETPSPYVAPVAPAPQTPVSVDTMQVQDGRAFGDPFDPLKADPRWSGTDGYFPFKLTPLIISAGPDGVYDIYSDVNDATLLGNNPYRVIIDGTLGPTWLGTPVDYDLDGLQHGDNITNHGLQVEVGSVQ